MHRLCLSQWNQVGRFIPAFCSFCATLILLMQAEDAWTCCRCFDLLLCICWWAQDCCTTHYTKDGGSPDEDRTAEPWQGKCSKISVLFFSFWKIIKSECPGSCLCRCVQSWQMWLQPKHLNSLNRVFLNRRWGCYCKKKYKRKRRLYILLGAIVYHCMGNPEIKW